MAEINECANVGAVTAAVAEGSNEVGTVYYSDTYGFEDRLQIFRGFLLSLRSHILLWAAEAAFMPPALPHPRRSDP